MSKTKECTCCSPESSEEFVRGLLKAREIASQPHTVDTIRVRLEEEIARAREDA